MKALRVSPAHSLLLRSQRLHCHLPNGPKKLNTRRPIKPFVFATLSRPTAEVFAEPSTSSASFETKMMPSPPPNRVSDNSLQNPPGFLGAVPDRTATDRKDNENIVDSME
ncbi:hypothetical protein L3X38_002909 [Prunus dulcis]|uniref:Uncharacterized protein n=1 Tax=Prunus dulcis TaxID=3755 RepID=A0AAD4ZLE4_PRUDU|nr:hypothetical protein L3X38_002909 [Prunus dulcis]